MANSEGQGRHCTPLIFLTLDFEEKPSLREFLTGSLVLGLFPIAFLLLAWIGHLGRWSFWLGSLILILIVLQVFLITIPRRIGLPILSALHLVNAPLIFGLAVCLVQRAWHSVHSDRQTD